VTEWASTELWLTGSYLQRSRGGDSLSESLEKASLGVEDARRYYLPRPASVRRSSARSKAWSIFRCAVRGKYTALLKIGTLSSAESYLILGATDLGDADTTWWSNLDIEEITNPEVSIQRDM